MTTAMLEVTKGTLCRACLKRCTDNDISSCRENDQLQNMFQFCISINTDEDHSLPFIICNYCREKLTCFNTFKKQCVESDVFYKRYVLYARKITNLQDEIDLPNKSCITEFENWHEINELSKEKILSQTDIEERNIRNTHREDQIDHVDLSQCDNICDSGDEDKEVTGGISKDHYVQVKNKNITNNVLQDDLSDLFSGNTYGKDVEPFIISAASGRYNCGKCDRWYKHKIYYEAHVKSHETGVFILECDICLRQFDKPESFRLHKIAHSGIKKYSCKICGKGFVFKHRLTVHEKTHLNTDRLPCFICHKTFKTQIFLSNHMVVHSEDRPFTCDKCKKSFKTKLRLNEHMKRCVGEKSHMCTLCGKCFFATHDLTIHMRSHSGEKPLECQYCSKRFLCHGHLIVHKRSHTGERPYACHICPKKFAIKRVLDNHLLIHTGDQPYSCSICGRPFRQRSALRTHLKSHNIIPQI